MLLLRWVLNAGAVLAIAYFQPGFWVESPYAACAAALVLGLPAAALPPLLETFGIRATLSTLAQWLFVANALLFWLFAETEVGFEVSGYGAALMGSILYTLVTLVTSWLPIGAKKSRAADP